MKSPLFLRRALALIPLASCLQASGQFSLPIAYTAPHIRSVLLYPDGAPLSGPFMELDGDAPLVLAFDDLSGDWPDCAWNVQHCNADWTAPSDLSPWDYLDGWSPARLDDVEQSFGGSIPFAHVRTTIPSEELRITRSGNYLLTVHRDGDPEDIQLIRRFVVYERLSDAEITPRRPFEADRVPTHQRLEVEVTLPPGHRWSVPMRDVRLTVLRNVDWTQAAIGVSASLVRGDVVRFDQDRGLTFPGSDRWRSADLKSLSYLAPGIEAIRESRTGEGPLWNVRLGQDASRRFRLQTGRPDLNGAFAIHNDRFDDVDLSSDYLSVTFSLDHKDFGDVPEVYLFGAMTGWSIDPRYQMQYDDEAQEYRLTTMLKQGWYDYRYLTIDDGQSMHAFEADHAGTPNLYTVFVHAPAPDGSDRIIGMETLNWK